MGYKEVRQKIKSQAVERKVPEFTPNTDLKAWAMALKARHDAGEKLSKTQITMYRDALRINVASEEE